ncbi:MAG: hypothetical protein V7K22_02805 [Nostoc sp.]|uniref:hypothetical protein n=1 Tax=unclassified Nostoc TaxID=2593658 RepID=UPI0025E4A817|nr:hypothetical protein [Nostoc sp. JL31]MBN3887768.1 hypothetical protein [Nostoc sp. JL31]
MRIECLHKAIALFLGFSVKRSHSLFHTGNRLVFDVFCKAIALWECNFKGMRY